jgi:hypothetical protein
MLINSSKTSVFAAEFFVTTKTILNYFDFSLQFYYSQMTFSVYKSFHLNWNVALDYDFKLVYDSRLELYRKMTTFNSSLESENPQGH